MTDHGQPATVKSARVYLRVSTDEQDLARQEAIVAATRVAGYYLAAVHREKASGARADRPELLRMIADLQPGEVVVAEKIDRISRLPLVEAERLVDAIRAKGARLAVPGIIDLSDWSLAARGWRGSCSRRCRTCCCGSRSRPRATTMRTGASDSAKASRSRGRRAGTPGAEPITLSTGASSRYARGA